MSIYTHPVLRSDTNNIKGDCTFEIDFNKNEELFITPKINNQEIVDLIKEEKAFIQVALENKKCFFKKYDECLLSGSSVILNPKIDPPGKYNVHLYVRSAHNDLDFSLKSFHPDYSGVDFNLKKGAPIAYLGNFSFNYQKDYQKDEEKGSIFSVHPQPDHEEGHFSVDYVGDNIVIQMNTLDHDNKYSVLEAVDPQLLMSTYILPTLYFAILDHREEEHEQRQWAITISEVLADKNLQDTDQLIAAQIILDDPVNKITKAVEALTRSHDDD